MDTLVLNAAYMPIDRISWQEALSNLVKGRAVVVEEYTDWTVHSEERDWKVPAIIRFVTKVAGLFRKSVKFNRHNVYLRDKGRCQYCGLQVSKADFTYDHVVPRRQGGVTKWNNVVVACLPCNQRKADRTPMEAKMRLRVEPCRPKSLPGASQMFRWQDGMPSCWKDYIAGVSYWHARLDS
jgi:5-methylcytosine-specific restriction endonuclease McrA